MIDKKNPHNLYFLKESYKNITPFILFYLDFEDEKNHYIITDNGSIALPKKDVMLYSAPDFEISKEEALSYLKFSLNEFPYFNCAKFISRVYTNESITFTLDDLVDALSNLLNEDISPYFYKNYLENFFSLVHHCYPSEYFVNDPLLEDEGHLVAQYVENFADIIESVLLKNPEAIELIKSILKEVEISTKNIHLPFDKREFTQTQKIFIVKNLTFENNKYLLNDFIILRKYNLILDELEKENNYDALVIQAYNFYKGSATNDVDYSESLKRFIKASKINDDGGYLNHMIGDIYYYGRIDNNPNYEKAFSHFVKSSIYKNKESMLKLIDMYLEGQYVEKDINAAFEFINSMFDDEMKSYFNDERSCFPSLCYRFALYQMQKLPLNKDMVIFYSLFVLSYYKNKITYFDNSNDSFYYGKRAYELLHEKLNISFLPFKNNYEINDASDLLNIFYLLNESKHLFEAEFKEDGDYLRINIRDLNESFNKTLLCLLKRYGIAKFVDSLILYFRKPHHAGFRKKSKIVFNKIEYKFYQGDISLYFINDDKLVYNLNTKFGYISTEFIDDETIYINKIKKDNNKEEYYCSIEPFLEGENVEIIKDDGTKNKGTIIYSKKTIKEDLPYPIHKMKYISH